VAEPMTPSDRLAAQEDARLYSGFQTPIGGIARLAIEQAAELEAVHRELVQANAMLEWVDQALSTAHPDTDVSDFAQSFPLVRKAADKALEAQAEEMRRCELEQELEAVQVERSAAQEMAKALEILGQLDWCIGYDLTGDNSNVLDKATEAGRAALATYAKASRSPEGR
jgi:hypothetical protein